MVEVGRAPVVDQRHHVGAGFAERPVEFRVGLVQPDDQTDRVLRPLHDLVGLAAQRVAILDAERLVDAAGNDAGAMDALAGDMPDDLLAELAGQNALLGEIRKGGGDAQDVALGDFALEAEQQVRRRKMKEMQRVGLDDLAVMQQAAQLLRGRGQRPVAGDDVHRLGRREQVAHRADAA